MVLIFFVEIKEHNISRGHHFTRVKKQVDWMLEKVFIFPEDHQLQTQETSAKTKSGRCRRGHLEKNKVYSIHVCKNAHLAHLERTFPYLVGVGLVLRLHSVRSRAMSWVTPTAVMSSFSCWSHVFLGRPRRLVPGMARFITLRVTLSASRLWTCPNQRRRPQRITASIGDIFRMRRISSFRMWSRLDTPRISRSILISVVAIFLLLVTFIAQHSLPYVRAGLIMASYTFALSLRGIVRSYNTPVNFLQLDHSARTRRSTSLFMVPSLSIIDPRYLKWSKFFSSSPFTFIGSGFPLLIDVQSLPH